MRYTVHHTSSKEGGIGLVLKEIPFLSEYNVEEDKKPYLGQGYYFWEFNLDYAKVWGRCHYKDSYFVSEAEILVDEEEDGYYLDLVGSRKDLVGFVELLKEFDFISKEGVSGIDLGVIIEYLRNDCPESAFPYKVVRAVDYLNNDKFGMKIGFAEGRKSYTILNPRIIISFKNQKDIVYLTKPFITFAN